jgi:hypothetical protein
MILGGMIKLIAQPPLSLVTGSYYNRLIFKMQEKGPPKRAFCELRRLSGIMRS